MSETLPDFEALLSRALAPVDPPEDLAERLETTLVELTEAAADELEAWELGAMHDPRNWIRPAAAIVVGASASSCSRSIAEGGADRSLIARSRSR